MNVKDIIRAWKDREYRESLSEEQLSLLPEMPIGNALNDEELLAVTGGSGGAQPNLTITETQDTNDSILTICVPGCPPR